MAFRLCVEILNPDSKNPRVMMRPTDANKRKRAGLSLDTRGLRCVSAKSKVGAGTALGWTNVLRLCYLSRGEKVPSSLKPPRVASLSVDMGGILHQTREPIVYVVARGKKTGQAPAKVILTLGVTGTEVRSGLSDYDIDKAPGLSWKDYGRIVRQKLAQVERAGSLLKYIEGKKEHQS